MKGIDGLFKTLLLLKKKKYAATKVTNYEAVMNGSSETALILSKEYKGIDVVRREYCEFSKSV